MCQGAVSRLSASKAVRNSDCGFAGVPAFGRFVPVNTSNNPMTILHGDSRRENSTVWGVTLARPNLVSGRRAMPSRIERTKPE
jgi:hypothetical protein